jgi:hypothetical protein
MNESFDSYIDLDGYIKQEFANLIMQRHGKSLSEVWREFGEKCRKEWKTWPRTLTGGIYSIRVYLKNGAQYVYLYAGLKDNILLFKVKNDKIIEFFKNYAHKYGKNEKKIDKFLKRHKNHNVYLEATLTGIGGIYKIVCPKPGKKLDLMDYEKFDP